MRKEIEKFHLISLSMHDSIMFETLIHPSNIVSNTVKMLTFFDVETDAELKPMRGYIAVKDVNGKTIKYFIEEQYHDLLPIRAEHDECEELLFKDSAKSKSIVLRPLNPKPFKITPNKEWDNDKEFIDQLIPFEHTNPDHFTLSKILAIMGYVSQVFLGVCSNSEFGKSSSFVMTDCITKKSPVFQPRSIPGILSQITGDGNIVFDEVGSVSSEVKKCMENFTLQVAGNSPYYINGALRSSNTKERYAVSEQSVTYLFNNVDQYSSFDKFFDNMFDNNEAINTRFLKVKLDGKLIEKFDKNFNVHQVAEENKMYYIKIAKHLLHLKKIKREHSYKLKFSHIETHAKYLNGRRRKIYEDILWEIDRYCQTEEEYKHFVSVFNQCIQDYSDMVNRYKNGLGTISVPKKEINIKNDLEKVLYYIKSKGQCSEQSVHDNVDADNIDEIILKLKQEGEIYPPKSGYVKIM